MSTGPSNDNPADIRKSLVENVNGLGLKQASMFIRDTQKSEKLAIVDRHILDYMCMMDITSKKNVKICSAKTYLEFEDELKRYASFLGIQVGYLDWAIWVTMRTLKKEKVH